MALLQYGNHYVDDKFTSLVEPNLFNNVVFQPGITFTDKYTVGPAGQILIHKPGIATVTAGTPGSDFTDVDVADATIALPLDKAYQRSRKIYNAVAATVAYPVAAAEIELATKECVQAWQKDCAAQVVTTTTTSVLGTTALSPTNAWKSILDDRAVLVKNGANPDVLIVTPDVYAILLQIDQFVKASDMAYGTAVSGQLGRVAGLNVFEYQGFAASVDYVMYDHDALSAVSAINMARVKDSENFNGIKCQVEIVSGFKLTNVSRALKKLNV